MEILNQARQESKRCKGLRRRRIRIRLGSDGCRKFLPLGKKSQIKESLLLSHFCFLHLQPFISPHFKGDWRKEKNSQGESRCARASECSFHYFFSFAFNFKTVAAPLAGGEREETTETSAADAGGLAGARRNVARAGRKTRTARCNQNVRRLKKKPTPPPAV